MVTEINNSEVHRITAVFPDIEVTRIGTLLETPDFKARINLAHLRQQLILKAEAEEDYVYKSLGSLLDGFYSNAMKALEQKLLFEGWTFAELACAHLVADSGFELA